MNLNTGTKRTNTNKKNTKVAVKDNINDYLENSTEKTNNFANEKISSVKEYGNRAAAVLRSPSDYVKKVDFVQTGNRIKRTVKEKPQIGIALAGVFGLLIGLLMGRKTS